MIFNLLLNSVPVLISNCFLIARISVDYIYVKMCMLNFCHISLHKFFKPARDLNV